MSEITIIKCDGVGCENQVGVGQVNGKEVSALEIAESAGWIRDEFDSDFCPTCQERAKGLEDSKADGADLAAFGELVGSEADKIEAEAQAQGLEKQKITCAKCEANYVQIDGALCFSCEESLSGKPPTKKEFDLALGNVVKNLRRDLKKQKKSKEFIEESLRLFMERAEVLRKKAI